MSPFKHIQQQKQNAQSAQVHTSMQPEHPSALTSPSNIQAGLDHANRFGHHISRISILPPVSSVDNTQEQNTPALPVNIQRNVSPSHAIPVGREPSANEIQQAAQAGIQTSTQEIPYARQLQRVFGRYDISQIQAHLGPRATASATAMHASAYATGNHVVFAGTPDLHLVAHEATHVLQQRAGVQLRDRIGHVGDRYEQHADMVARQVVAGQSVEAMLPIRSQKQRVGLALQPQLQEAIPHTITHTAVQRVKLNKANINRDKVKAAFLLAILMVKEAKVNLSLAKINQDRVAQGVPPVVNSAIVTNAPQQIGLYLGTNVTSDNALQYLESLEQQLTLLDKNDLYSFYDGQSDPFTNATSDVQNMGTGNDAEILFRYPAFFALSDEVQAESLIHEASHGLEPTPTRDIAYQHERLFDFLPGMNRAVHNADSVSAFARAAAIGRAPTPRPLDTFNQTSSAATRSIRQALAQVGLAGRATRKACRGIITYLKVHKQEGNAFQSDNYSSGILNFNYFIRKNIIQKGLGFSNYITFFEGLYAIADNTYQATSLRSITFTHTLHGSPQWLGDQDTLDIADTPVDTDPADLVALLLRITIERFTEEGSKEVKTAFANKLIPAFQKYMNEELSGVSASSDSDSSSSDRDDSSSSDEDKKGENKKRKSKKEVEDESDSASE
jgi:hypothetical protein